MADALISTLIVTTCVEEAAPAYEHPPPYKSTLQLLDPPGYLDRPSVWNSDRWQTRVCCEHWWFFLKGQPLIKRKELRTVSLLKKCREWDRAKRVLAFLPSLTTSCFMHHVQLIGSTESTNNWKHKERVREIRGCLRYKHFASSEASFILAKQWQENWVIPWTSTVDHLVSKSTIMVLDNHPSAKHFPLWHSFAKDSAFLTSVLVGIAFNLIQSKNVCNIRVLYAADEVRARRGVELLWSYWVSMTDHPEKHR